MPPKRPSNPFFRVEQLPPSLEAEFRRAARDLGIGLGAAYSAIMRTLPLDAAFLLGQVERDSMRPRKVGKLGFHLPAADKVALHKAAERKGLKKGVAGVLVLLAKRGQIASAITEGLGVKAGV